MYANKTPPLYLWYAHSISSARSVTPCRLGANSYSHNTAPRETLGVPDVIVPAMTSHPDIILRKDVFLWPRGMLFQISLWLLVWGAHVYDPFCFIQRKLD